MSSFFLITSVVAKAGYPLTSCLVHSGRGETKRTYCGTCFDSSRDEPTDFYLHGFSDLRHMDDPSYGFLEPGPPLIGHRDALKKLGSRLSGVVPVRVGYRDWNQSEQLSEAEAFSRAPRLGLLYVVSRWEGVCRADGTDLPRCAECGGPKLPIDSDLSGKLGIRGTPSTDFVILAGGEQDRTCVISEPALQALDRVGFGNVKAAQLPRFD